MSVEDFTKFCENLFKTPRDRRAAEAPQKSIALETLWLNIPTELKTEEVKNLYTKANTFLTNARASPTTPPASSATMSFDFDLKAAGATVPDFTGKAEQLKDFLDCARLYLSMLKETSKPLFLQYLLKVKLKGKAKLAINTNISTFADFEKHLKNRFNPKTTIAAVQNELAGLKQGSSSVQTFASKIEDLICTLNDLLVREKGESSRDLIQELSDLTALNVFKKGCNESIQGTLVAARVDSFSAGVSIATEAETNASVLSTNSVNYVRHESRSHHRGGKFSNYRRSRRGGNRHYNNYNGYNNNGYNNNGYNNNNNRNNNGQRRYNNSANHRSGQSNSDSDGTNSQGSWRRGRGHSRGWSRGPRFYQNQRSGAENSKGASGQPTSASVAFIDTNTPATT